MSAIHCVSSQLPVERLIGLPCEASWLLEVVHRGYLSKFNYLLLNSGVQMQIDTALGVGVVGSVKVSKCID